MPKLATGTEQCVPFGCNSLIRLRRKMTKTRESRQAVPLHPLCSETRGLSPGFPGFHTLNMWTKLRRCFSGVIQQPGGELDAAGGAGKKELAARGQRAGGSESCGHSFGCGILPPVRRAGEGLPRRSVAGIESVHAEPGVEPDSGSLVRCSELTHPWVGQTLTVYV